jgi:hypothetical protein
VILLRIFAVNRNSPASSASPLDFDTRAIFFAIWLIGMGFVIRNIPDLSIPDAFIELGYR